MKVCIESTEQGTFLVYPDDEQAEAQQLPAAPGQPEQPPQGAKTAKSAQEACQIALEMLSADTDKANQDMFNQGMQKALPQRM